MISSVRVMFAVLAVVPHSLEWVTRLSLRPRCPPFTRSPRRRGRAAWRQIEAERLRGLEVDDQLESRGAFRRQFGNFGALQDLASHGSNLAEKTLNIRAIAEQSALSCDLGE